MAATKRIRFTSKGIVALLLLAALVVGAIVLNVALNKKDDQLASAGKGDGKGAVETEKPAKESAVSAGVYLNSFSAFRDERSSLRAKEIDYLRMIINEQGTDAGTMQNAQQRLMELVDNMEKEFSIESMIRSKGFLDAAVTMRSDAVSVVVSGDSLTDEEVARILDIVKTETGSPASSIRISVSGTGGV